MLRRQALTGGNKKVKGLQEPAWKDTRLEIVEQTGSAMRRGLHHALVNVIGCQLVSRWVFRDFWNSLSVDGLDHDEKSRSRSVFEVNSIPALTSQLR